INIFNVYIILYYLIFLISIFVFCFSRLFFRRHYPTNTVTFCDTDPQDRKWNKPEGGTAKLFGFVARKQGSTTDNVSHLFAEMDPDQPANAIVNFVSKMIAVQK
ncbi:tensin-like, partial [Notothenia coriiceps]|uniref:Tensin-like n=1 Tax=Notothenia coriiceps TaxID=8208 RepID=A0A6I9N9N6_9TELE